MPKSGLNVALKGLDDLFSSEETRQEEQREQVQQIPVDELFPFKNHPFKVLDDDAMTRTVEDGNNQKLWRVTMEYSKEDLMEAKKQIWGVGENMGTEESKKSGRRTHNFGIMQWVTNLMNFTER